MISNRFLTAEQSYCKLLSMQLQLTANFKALP